MVKKPFKWDHDTGEYREMTQAEYEQAKKANAEHHQEFYERLYDPLGIKKLADSVATRNSGNGNSRPPQPVKVVDADAWAELFHSFEELDKLPPVEYAITGWLQRDGVTMIGGLPGHSKTWLLLSTVRALLTGRPLFGHSAFAVTEQADKVVYLLPESSAHEIKARLDAFELMPFVGREFFIRTLSKDNDILELDDPRLTKAVQGGHLFIDTAIRSLLGDENSATDQQEFSAKMFRFLDEGAKSITIAHHSGKELINTAPENMTLGNVFRGSIEFAAMCATGWGIKQIDGQSNTIFVRNVKARNFLPCPDFVLAGRPYIDERHDFLMSTTPGTVVAIPKAANKRSEKAATQRKLAAQMFKDGTDINAIGQHFRKADRTIREWLQREGIEPTEATEGRNVITTRRRLGGGLRKRQFRHAARASGRRLP